ncbi:WhiB family transcriptional regulator [Streptomyces sp. NPDC127110]|uniref:WhiB family transcriptional regulator n=1 Tax=Streptomyces sp. NPDC127110 TaxID=3345362 RepID=UPI003642AFEF
MSRFDWHEEAPCAEVGAEIFFAEKGRTDIVAEARKICASCPLRERCLDEAMRQEEGQPKEFRSGIRAGLSPTQRARLATERRKAAA